MKNKIKLLVAIAIIFVVFTVCYFVIPFPHKGTAVYVLMYIFTSLAILAQLIPFYITFFQTKTLNNVIYSTDKFKNLKSIIYSLPLMRIGILYLIAQFILTLVLTVINCFVAVPAWIAVVLIIALLGYTVVNFIVKLTMKETIEQLEEKAVADVAFIESFRADCSSFLAGFSYAPLFEKVRELKETIQYSDPVSHASLYEIEEEMSSLFIQIKDDYNNGQFMSVESNINKLISLIKERNIRCRQLK